MKNYYVYRHIFPNEKSYIGISGKAIEKRWGANGCYYSNQPKMWRAICEYGWDNVRHEILYYNLDEETAKKIEQEMIIKYDSINDGYNSSIGGDNINTTYLCEDLLAILRKFKQELSFQACYVAGQLEMAKMDAEEADYWNECYNAVIHKKAIEQAKYKAETGRELKGYSLSDWFDVETILFEMTKYDIIYWLHDLGWDDKINSIRDMDYSRFRYDKLFSQDKRTKIEQTLDLILEELKKRKGGD